MQLSNDRSHALSLLGAAIANPSAEFRPGQWEAIDALVNQRERLLVVQRTGWGKSSVYFIATRILRDRGRGPTLVVSPLLALMRNQIEAAGRLGIRALSINSTNWQDWPDLRRAVLDDEADALLISPERLANDDFVEDVLLPIAGTIGLLVVDEAHSISDWGHDFRPDYRRLVNVLRRMPDNLSIPGTTATANDRVIADVQAQLGGVRIQRGPLMRDTLALQTIRLPSQAELLGRGGALGLALERWQRAGLWVMTRSDPEYPRRLKERLGQESPPVLYGCGDKTLLNHGGIAVVGSRSASENDLAFTERLGSDAAGQGIAIVSGGARGVDQHAMLGAVGNAGVAVGVLADSLLRSATSAKYRKHVASGRLVLISPFNPEARFNVGNAMSRNRYIYCLSDAAVVIGSKTGRGGTWSGAIEDLEAGWVPLWVKRSPDAGSGNPELAARGARWLPEDPGALGRLADGDQALLPDEGQAQDYRSLEEKKQSSRSATTEPRPPAPPVVCNEEPVPRVRNDAAPKPAPTTPAISGSIGFYELFLNHLAELTSEAPLPPDEICERLNDIEKSCVEKFQVKKWLQRGMSDGEIEKLARPVRYRRRKMEGAQASLPLEGVD